MVSVETQEYRMPQPEQWLSEHEPWSTLAVVLTAIMLVIVVGWLA